MGFGGISLWQLLIILVIVILLFGTKRLKNVGGDLGSAFKGFKKAMNENDSDSKGESAKLEKSDNDAEFTSEKASNEDKQKSE